MIARRWDGFNGMPPSLVKPGGGSTKRGIGHDRKEDDLDLPPKEPVGD